MQGKGTFGALGDCGAYGALAVADGQEVPAFSSRPHGERVLARDQHPLRATRLHRARHTATHRVRPIRSES